MTCDDAGGDASLANELGGLTAALLLLLPPPKVVKTGRKFLLIQVGSE